MMKTFRKKYLITLTFALAIVIIFTPIISLLSFAEEEHVKKFTDKVAQELITTMKNTNTSEEEKRAQIKDVIEKNFDVIWMSKFALGINYKQLSDSQKEKYESLYLNYLLNNYFPILMRYDSDDSYEILKIHQVDQKDYDVKIKLTTRKAENPIMLRYRVRFEGQNYKCLDMAVEGVSTLISQRAEFTSVIQRSGINSFLKTLENHKIRSTTPAA